MKIIDTFTFFNELDLLEIRLNILNDVVDRFVLVEATRTFQNGEKPLVFAENRERFAPFLDKIRHIVVDDMPDSAETRVLEAHQRNAIARGLADAAADDQVILSDLDEIPNPAKIVDAAAIPGIKAFRQSLHYYYVDYVNRELAGLPWSMMAERESFLAPQDLRQKLIRTQEALLTGQQVDDVTFVEDGGWHFSYLGGLDSILAKLRAFADPEYKKERYRDPEAIRSAIAEGRDLFGRDLHFERVPLDSRFPSFLRLNRARFGKLFYV